MGDKPTGLMRHVPSNLRKSKWTNKIVGSAERNSRKAKNLAERNSVGAIMAKDAPVAMGAAATAGAIDALAPSIPVPGTEVEIPVSLPGNLVLFGVALATGSRTLAMANIGIGSAHAYNFGASVVAPKIAARFSS